METQARCTLPIARLKEEKERMPDLNNPTKVIYIAGPYTGDITGNIIKAGKVAMKLWEHGFIAICPHLNSAYFGCSQAPESTFLNGYLELLRRCDGILMLEEWTNSKGSIAEIDLAYRLGIPIFYNSNFNYLLNYSWEVILPLTLKGQVE